jgi:uncharacterized damage-inducible protein DinB
VLLHGSMTSAEGTMRTIIFRTSAIIAVLGAAIAAPGAASAQAANPLSANAKAQFTGISGFVARSAEKIPDSLYTFRATPEVRSIAQLFGHIADAYFAMCSTAAGTPPPQSGFEKSATTKPALVKALADGVAYCQGVMQGMTDAKGTEAVPFYFGPTPRLGVLYFVTTHTYEHYGNLVTYMRLNKIVPPSSEGPTR